MVAGAAIMGASSLLGAGIQANAAEQASQAQVQAQEQVLQTANQNLQPIIAQGKALAAPAQAQLSGFLTNPAAAMANYPGYEYTLGQTEQAGMNAGTVMGLGGNTAYGIMQNAAGITSQYENQYYNQLYNALSLGLGTQTNAAGTLTGAASSAISGIGNAQAQGLLGVGNALSSGLSGLGSAGLVYALTRNNNGLLTGAQQLGPDEVTPYTGQSGFD